METDASAHPLEMSAPSMVRARSPFGLSKPAGSFANLGADLFELRRNLGDLPTQLACRGAVEPEECCVPAQQHDIELGIVGYVWSPRTPLPHALKFDGTRSVSDGGVSESLAAETGGSGRRHVRLPGRNLSHVNSAAASPCEESR